MVDVKIENSYKVIIENKEEEGEIQSKSRADLSSVKITEYPTVVSGDTWNNGNSVKIIFYKADSLRYSDYKRENVRGLEDIDSSQLDVKPNRLYSVEVFTKVLDTICSY